MPLLSYPTATDVEALLKSAGYWPTDSGKQDFARLQAEIGAVAAVDEWARLTGWNPFLADNLATERVFDGVDSRGFLDFDGAAVSVTSLSINGTVQTLNEQYQLHPQNAASRKEAIRGLQLGSRGGYSNFYGAAGRIVVTARWGRVDAIPGDAWQAMQQKAALITLTQIENLQSVASISEDGFTKAYDVVGIVTQKDLAAGGMGGGGIWGSNFEKIAIRWQRVVL